MTENRYKVATFSIYKHFLLIFRTTKRDKKTKDSEDYFLNLTPFLKLAP